MEYSIRELVGNLTTDNTNRMIPILIGKTKTLYKESLNFIDDNKTQLSVSNIDNSLIDETTLLVNIKSWNLKTENFSFDTITAGAIKIDLNLALAERLPNTSILVIVDNDNNILFSINIKEFIYEQSSLKSVILNNPVELDGTYSAYFINLETKNITGSFNILSKILTIDSSFIFQTPSFNTIYPTSSLNYIGASTNYSVKYIDKITQDIIDAEKNNNLKTGLILDKSVVIISYPYDFYLSQLLEDLEKLTTGYYIVPVDLSNMSINAIVNFVKSQELNSLFYVTIIPATYIDSEKLTTATFTKA